MPGYLPDTELAETRKLIWSGTTAAPQEPTNDSGSTTPAHSKIMSKRMKRVQTKTTHTDAKTPLSLTNFFRTYIQTKHIQKKKNSEQNFPTCTTQKHTHRYFNKRK